MMKKTTQTLLLVFSGLLLLVSVTVSANAQEKEPQDFNGVWNTVTDKGKKIVMRLEQRRSVVRGSYRPLHGGTVSYKPMDGSIYGIVKVSASTAEPMPQTAGSIRGTVENNVLRFKWYQDNGQGAGRFTLSSDGQSFQGTFSATNNPDDTSGGTWNGTRAPAPDDGYYKMICRGGPDFSNVLSDTVKLWNLNRMLIRVYFRRSATAPRGDYSKIDPGTCSWDDRTVEEDEPRVIHLYGSYAEREQLNAVLHSPNQLYEFYIRLTPVKNAERKDWYFLSGRHNRLPPLSEAK